MQTAQFYDNFTQILLWDSVDAEAVFGLSGEWSGHGQGVHICGAICGAQPTDADEAATKARTVGFRIVFSLLKAMCCRKQLGEYTQGLWTNKMIVYFFLCSLNFLAYICLFLLSMEES